MDEHLSNLRSMRERAMQGGGANRVEQQHARGKLTARERLALLVDEMRAPPGRSGPIGPFTS